MLFQFKNFRERKADNKKCKCLLIYSLKKSSSVVETPNLMNIDKHFSLFITIKTSILNYLASFLSTGKLSTLNNKFVKDL